MMKYLFRILIIVSLIISFNSCSEDPAPQSGENTNTDPGGDDGNSNDTGGGDINDPQCDYDTGADYALSIQISEDDNYYDYQIYLLDTSGNIVEESPVPNNGPATGWTIPDSAGETFHLVFKKYIEGSNVFEGYLFLDMPPGEYHYIKEHNNYPDYEELNFSINHIGDMPFIIRNFSFSIFEDYYSTQDGGTYFFGADLTNFGNYFPEHGGFFVSMRASFDDSDRYYWSTDPPFSGTPGGLNYENLPLSTNLIDVSLDQSIENLSQLNLYGFVPQNDSPYFGNRIGYDGFQFEQIRYSIPDDLFNRYRYEISYGIPSQNSNVTMARNSTTPFQHIDGTDYSFTVNSASLENFSFNTQGDFDALVLGFGDFEDIPPQYYNFTIIAPNRGDGLIEYDIPFSTLNNEIFDEFCFVCMDYYGASLMGYENLECYRSMLMTQFKQTDAYIMDVDETKEYTRFSK